jgi:hypothetical protein
VKRTLFGFSIAVLTLPNLSQMNDAFIKIKKGQPNQILTNMTRYSTYQAEQQ